MTKFGIQVFSAIVIASLAACGPSYVQKARSQGSAYPLTDTPPSPTACQPKPATHDAPYRAALLETC